MRRAAQADDVRAAHARYFAAREVDVLALWDGPRQQEAYEWFARELPNLRTAFRWAADHRDLDTAATIAVYATFLGFWTDRHEPIAWAESLSSPHKPSNTEGSPNSMYLRHNAIEADGSTTFLSTAGNAWAATESGHFDTVPDALDATLHPGYIFTDPARWVEERRDPDNHIFARQALAVALAVIGLGD